MKIVNLNKGAMFGLDCRALKKQFGKLFLASRHSEAPQGASDSCGYTKRGAMFGLDARIALAIFGALSVISGAALYSAIQNAKATAVLTEVRNIVKSFEQYYLDRGAIPSDASTVSGYYNIHADVFLTNMLNESTWNGPYYSAAKRGGGYTADMEFSANKGSYFLVGAKSYQQNSYSTWSTACRTYLANDKCFLAVTVKDLDLSLAKKYRYNGRWG